MITETETRILQSLHLRGVMGNCGSLNKKQRLGILNSLIEKKLLTQTGQLTTAGIEASRPKF